jgi:hypothetical protein
MHVDRILIIFALLAATANAGVPPDHQRVLMPLAISGEVPGAHGSRWTTVLSLVNTSEHWVSISGYDWAPAGCGIATCPPAPLTPPGVTFYPRLRSGVFTQGAVFSMPVADADDVAFQLRVQDVSRQSETWGTSIPVVRETAFRRRVSLLDVPVEEGFRQAVRVYTLDAPAGTSVRIRYYRVNPLLQSPVDPLRPPPPLDALLLEEEVPLAVERRAGIDLGYAEILDLSRFLADGQRLRIDVEHTELALWAFVSVTHNETQHVTIIAPATTDRE